MLSREMTMHRLTRVLLLCIHVITADVLSFRDDKPALQSGIYCEDMGQIRIVIDKWDWVAYLSLTQYDERWDLVRRHVAEAKTWCEDAAAFRADCERFLLVTDALERKITHKKSLISSLLGRDGDEKSGSAHLLYGMCDLECVNRFDGNVKRLRDANVDQMKITEEKVKIVRLGGELWNKSARATAGPAAVGNATGERRRVQMNDRFTYVRLLLADHALETDALLDTVSAAKAGGIDAGLLDGRELLEQLEDVRAALSGDADAELPVRSADAAGARELLLELSDRTAYYSRGNVVFAAAIPLVHPDEFTVYGPTPAPRACRLRRRRRRRQRRRRRHDGRSGGRSDGRARVPPPGNGYLAVSRSRRLYASYDHFDRRACKRRARDDSPPLCSAAAVRRPRELTVCEATPPPPPLGAGRVPDNCDVVRVCGAAVSPSRRRRRRRHGNERRHGGTVVFVTCDRHGDGAAHAIGFVEMNETCDGYAAGRHFFVPGKPDRRRPRYPDPVPDPVVPGPDGRKPSGLAGAGVTPETGRVEYLNNVTSSRSRAETNGTKSDDDVYDSRANNDNRILFYTTWSVVFICVGMFVMDYAKTSIEYFQKRTPAESVEMSIFENNQLHGFSSQSNIDLISGDPIETIFSTYPYS